MPSFTHEGRQISYREFGAGPRACVLIHGLLFSKRMHERLAADLAGSGNRVITIDLLGHGASDRPTDMRLYSMGAFAQQVLGLLDHLGIDRAVIAGTSLGANTALEVCSAAPQRVQGMVIEMPVLDNALLASAVAFTPLMVGLTFGEPVMKLVQGAARLVPSRGMPFLADLVLDTLRQDPAPSAAVLQGLFFARVAPPSTERRTFTPPALVIGHRRDPVHPFSDAGMLVKELQDARLMEADSLLELRLAPDRLTDEIAGFLDACWTSGKRRKQAGSPATVSAR